jgi:PTS system mannose-specific IID component
MDKKMIREFIVAYSRVFFIQSLWNFERQQNAGFLFLIEPFLTKFYSDDAQKREAYLRHLEFFNTHPYMAGIIAAIVIKMEKEIAEGNRELIPNVSNLKSAMASPLAALGDSFFWGILRTACALLAILLIILSAGFEKEPFLAFSPLIPFVFLFAYNFFHIFARYFFMAMAFAFGRDMISALAKPQFRVFLNVVKAGSLLSACSALLAYLVFFGWQIDKFSFFDIPLIDLAVFAACFIAALSFGNKASCIKIYLIIALCIILAYFGA